MFMFLWITQILSSLTQMYSYILFLYKILQLLISKRKRLVKTILNENSNLGLVLLWPRWQWVTLTLSQK